MGPSTTFLNSNSSASLEQENFKENLVTEVEQLKAPKSFCNINKLDRTKNMS